MVGFGCVCLWVTVMLVGFWLLRVLIVLVFVVSFGIWFSVGVVYSAMLVWRTRLRFGLLYCVFILACLRGCWLFAVRCDAWFGRLLE